MLLRNVRVLVPLNKEHKVPKETRGKTKKSGLFSPLRSFETDSILSNKGDGACTEKQEKGSGSLHRKENRGLKEAGARSE